MKYLQAVISYYGTTNIVQLTYLYLQSYIATTQDIGIPNS